MKKSIKLSVLLSLFILLGNVDLSACTGVRLIAKDGSVIYGRTMEWGAFELNSRVAIIPRGYTFTGHTPDGHNGKKYSAKYGVVGLDMLGKEILADGMNEQGLAAGLFYHPGYAVYPEYNKQTASNSISAQEVINYILTQFASVEEVRKGMEEVDVVGIVEPKLGIVAQGHFMVTDRTGQSIVIEYTDGKLKIHNAPLGVITNSPNYDWHMTNLSNYANLSMYSVPKKELDGVTVAPLGAGSGMIGLPGDNTPPSRFVRAAAWSQTVRNIPNAKEATYEVLRVLDNFQLPIGPDGAEGAGGNNEDGMMRSATLWTTAWDLKNLKFNYHTQHNRRVRQLDIKAIDFSKIGKDIKYIQLDDNKEQDISMIKPNF